MPCKTCRHYQSDHRWDKEGGYFECKSQDCKCELFLTGEIPEVANPEYTVLRYVTIVEKYYSKAICPDHAIQQVAEQCVIDETRRGIVRSEYVAFHERKHTGHHAEKV